MALTKALSAGQQKVEVKTSSQNVIKSMTEWVANWKRNGWKNAKKKPVDNKEDLIELDRAVESLMFYKARRILNKNILICILHGYFIVSLL